MTETYEDVYLSEGRQYLKTRARQGLAEGYVWDGKFHTIDMFESGTARKILLTKGGEVFKAVYLPEEFRGSGRFRAALEQDEYLVLTVRACGLASYYDYKKIPYRLVGHHMEWDEYQRIQTFYEGRKARRTKVPYINHIDEGLGVLYQIGASENAKKAYCLHPIFQIDRDLRDNAVYLDQLDPKPLALALEYRNIANAYLSNREIDSLKDVSLSPLKDVNDMLVADKVQNYKDFLKYHDGTHPRSDKLHQYFQNWFEKLDVDYDELSQILEPF